MTREEKALRWYANRVAASEYSLAKELKEVAEEVADLRWRTDPQLRFEVRREQARQLAALRFEMFKDIVESVTRTYNATR